MMASTWQHLLIIVLFTLLIPLIQAFKDQDCQPLPYLTLEHGSILTVGKDRFRFKCNEGYFLGGPSTTRCNKGNWTSLRSPICHRAEGRCELPPPVANAQTYAEDDNTVGSVVLYICDEGHIILGNSQRTCLSSGYWSGIAPACMNETEPLQNIAERLDKQFISKLGQQNLGNSLKGRYLDQASLNKGLELVILIDRSSSVDPVDLETGKDFIKFLFREFKVKNGDNLAGTRAAVVAFGTKVDLIFNIDNSSIDSPRAASAALDKIQPGGGGTAMVPAFATTFMEVVHLLRPGAKRALFLITDGEPNIGGEHVTPEEISSQLEEYEKFEIFTVGIGRDINRQLLSRISSEPVINHVFLLDKFSDLKEVMAIIKNHPTAAPPPSPERCGHLNNEKSPWTAAVYTSHSHTQIEDVNGTTVTESSITAIDLCAGVLICDQWVLTSASCFFEVHHKNVSMNLEEAFVVLGENNLLKLDQHQLNFYAERIILHPNFDPMHSLLNNLALLELNEPALMDTYKTICLPPTDTTVPMHIDPAMNASVVGWGLKSQQKRNDHDKISAYTTTFDLQVKGVDFVSESECKASLKQKIHGSSYFCAKSGILTPCIGNIGSPIVGEDSHTGINHVLGILSERKNCEKGYNYYTELRPYIKWINQVTSECHLRHWN